MSGNVFEVLSDGRVIYIEGGMHMGDVIRDHDGEGNYIFNFEPIKHVWLNADELMEIARHLTAIENDPSGFIWESDDD